MQTELFSCSRLRPTKPYSKQKTVELTQFAETLVPLPLAGTEHNYRGPSTYAGFTAGRLDPVLHEDPSRLRKHKYAPAAIRC